MLTSNLSFRERFKLAVQRAELIVFMEHRYRDQCVVFCWDSEDGLC